MLVSGLTKGNSRTRLENYGGEQKRSVEISASSSRLCPAFVNLKVPLSAGDGSGGLFSGPAAKG